MITVHFRGKRIDIAPDSTFESLIAQIKAAVPLDPTTIKIVHKGALLTSQEEFTSLPLPATLFVTGSTIDEVAAVKSQRDDPTLRSFEAEELRELRRRGLPAGPSSSSNKPPPSSSSSPYGFQRYRALTAQEIPGARPPPAEALALLHQLASDPGIVHLVTSYRWSIGLLSEMPPEGKVGVSPVCILGVNINQGMEISLRLRTDDLKGFRKYDRIRETLVHELAHMRYGDHDDDFKAFNSLLLREAAAADWRSRPAAQLLGPASVFQPDRPLTLEEAERLRLASDPAYALMRQTAAQSGSALGGEWRGEAFTEDPRAAAAEAAMRRLGAEGEPERPRSPSLEREGTAPAPASTLDTDSGPAKPSSRGNVDSGAPGPVAPLAPQPFLPEPHAAPPSSSSPAPPNEPVPPPTAKEEGVDPELLAFLAAEAGLEGVVGPLAEKIARIQGAASALRQGGSEGQETLRVVRTLVKNLADHPHGEDSAKYRRVRQANPTIARTVGRFEPARDILTAVGFAPSFEDPSVWVMQRNDPGLLYLAVSLLE